MASMVLNACRKVKEKSVHGLQKGSDFSGDDNGPSGAWKYTAFCMTTCSVRTASQQADARGVCDGGVQGNRMAGTRSRIRISRHSAGLVPLRNADGARGNGVSCTARSPNCRKSSSPPAGTCGRGLACLEQQAQVTLEPSGWRVKSYSGTFWGHAICVQPFPLLADGWG